MRGTNPFSISGIVVITVWYGMDPVGKWTFSKNGAFKEGASKREPTYCTCNVYVAGFSNLEKSSSEEHFGDEGERELLQRLN